MRTTEKVAITVAVIGLTGTIGAALISSGAFRQDSGPSREAAKQPENSAAADKMQFAPHAPAIQVGGHITLWGEQTRLLTLDPGKHEKLLAQELYTHATTFPGLSCAGPGYVPYTWQVRDPYPEGGDLEIRAMIPRSGGNTEQVAMGAMGRGEMGGCDEHFFYNRGLKPMQVEVRYSSAVSDEASINYYKREAEAASAETAAIDTLPEAAEAQ